MVEEEVVRVVLVTTLLGKEVNWFYLVYIFTIEVMRVFCHFSSFPMMWVG
jgi:hypothetical protein